MTQECEESRERAYRPSHSTDSRFWSPLAMAVVMLMSFIIPCRVGAQGSAPASMQGQSVRAQGSIATPISTDTFSSTRLGQTVSTSTAASTRPTAVVTTVRVLATRSHMQCPLPGKNTRTLSIDSPGEWDDTVENQNEITALGRQVRWKHERVLIHALESKPYGDLRLESPTKVIRLSQGVLYWPVRQWAHDVVRDKDEKRSKPNLTRPCVMAIIDRAYWQRIRVVPARPLSRDPREARDSSR